MPAFFRQLLQVARYDFSLFQRFHGLRYAVTGVLFIPALYAFIYLSSVWDPYARTSQLPVAIVQEDQGTTYRGQTINIGADLVASLESQRAFHYQRFNNGDAARQAVRKGDMVFALIVPRDFSLHAVPGNEAGGGKLVIYTSEGNSYNGAGFARRFAPELAHQVNETLNEKRWALVLETAAGSARNLDTLRNGMLQLRDASAELANGATQARAGGIRLEGALAQLAPTGKQLSEGMQQTGAGLRQMQAKLPSNEALNNLKAGASSVAKHSSDLSDGLEKLSNGAGLLAGAGGEFEAGAQQLHEGLQRARDAQLQIGDGAKQVNTGIAALTDGVSQLGDGINAIVSQLPRDTALQQWNAALQDTSRGAQALGSGLTSLDDGAARLGAGIALLYESLPKDNPGIEGNPKGLAISVEPELEIVAPVANNGTGFAVNFVPLALWVGAVMAALIFQLRHVPTSAQGVGQVALVTGKFVLPALIAITQSIVMLLMLVFVFKVAIPSTLTFGLTLICASLTFLAIIFALIRLFGDTGKVISVLFLILQLSSAGALMPVELTGRAFQILHPLLPFTWVVKAFRASLFGAYDGAWLLPWSIAILSGVISLVIATIAGKWKIVADDDYAPAIDLSPTPTGRSGGT